VNDQAAILKAILAGYKLSILGDHGVFHWARVLENGIEMAKKTGADAEVVALFALFHDSRRLNEYMDDEHGMRGGGFARSLRDTLVHMEDARFELLYEACRLHTDGYTTGNPTLLACWDADRLDLGRVGITPEPHRLCTEAARGLLEWAHPRAVSGHKPTEVLSAWGMSAKHA
jgi:uncharacterized protein